MAGSSRKSVADTFSVYSQDYPDLLSRGKVALPISPTRNNRNITSKGGPAKLCESRLNRLHTTDISCQSSSISQLAASICCQVA